MSTQVKTEEQVEVINTTKAVALTANDKMEIEKTFSDAKDFRSL
jgi:hypothetical protein